MFYILYLAELYYEDTIKAITACSEFEVFAEVRLAGFAALKELLDGSGDRIFPSRIR